MLVLLGAIYLQGRGLEIQIIIILGCMGWGSIVAASGCVYCILKRRTSFI
jgi:hypothetical protein